MYNLITSNGLSPTKIEKSNIPPIVLQVTVGGDLVRSMSIALEFISRTPLLSGLPAEERLGLFIRNTTPILAYSFMYGLSLIGKL